MAFTSPLTWVSQAVTAALMNQQLRDNMNETAPGIASAAGRLIVTDAANSIVERVPDAASIATSETTASTSFTDLATAGPTVTLTTGTKVLIAVSCIVQNNTSGAECMVGYDISGASTLGPSSVRSYRATSNAAADTYAGSYVEIREGLTAGSNVLKLEYRVDAGTGTFDERRISVVPF